MKFTYTTPTPKTYLKSEIRNRCPLRRPTRHGEIPTRRGEKKICRGA